MALIGVALIAAAGVLFYVALRQPSVYENTASTTQTEYAEETESESEKDNTTVKPSQGVKATEKNTAAADTNEDEIQVTYPLNLNKTTAEELMTIDGLGEVRACAIIEYRDYLGKYTSVEQIMQIKGIDEEIYKQVAGYLTV